MSLAEIELRKQFLNLGSHGRSYIDYRLLVCDTVTSGGNFRRWKRLGETHCFPLQCTSGVFLVIYFSVTSKTSTRLHDVRFQKTVIYIKNCNAEYNMCVITVAGHLYFYVCPNFARS